MPVRERALAVICKSPKPCKRQNIELKSSPSGEAFGMELRLGALREKEILDPELSPCCIT
jgi:hypothetical protein